MNERIRNLRTQSLEAVNTLSAERAILITQFYMSDIAQQESVPVIRALAFKYILEYKSICINEGELIVGERGPAPKATPTYPEICLHSLNDLDILDQRPKVSFKVDDITKKKLPPSNSPRRILSLNDSYFQMPIKTIGNPLDC